LLARLVVVSNRVALPDRDGGNQAGGLAVAVRAALKRHPGLWFGWSGRVAAPGGGATTGTVEHAGLSHVGTHLPEEDYQEYYNGFANRVLWPILHYRLDLAEFSRRDLTGYMRVNERFASELSGLLAPDDLVWVHDYHLFPLGEALRHRDVRNRIGFFLHTPIPPPEILTALPNHERLIPAVAHYDLVGFQTESDAANFARYLKDECRMPSRDHSVFQAGERSVHIGAFPVGVETMELSRLARRSARSPFVREVIDSL